MRIFNIIGTDTNSGKTYISCQLMHYFTKLNYTSASLKPIASGQTLCGDDLINPDVVQLKQAANYPLTYQQINPFNLLEPIAPHLAAAKMGLTLSVQDIHAQVKQIVSPINPDFLLIEGIGGIMTPLNEHETYLDLLRALDYPVILVVGMQLGCLNHALLSIAAIKQSGLALNGWIANHIDPTMLMRQENITYLQQVINAPLLAQCQYSGTLQAELKFMEQLLCH